MSDRRDFLKKGASALGLCWLGYGGVRAIQAGEFRRSKGEAFRGDAPSELDPYCHVASFFESDGHFVTCKLCPHGCVLGNEDRGLCRVRFVKEQVLYSSGYGNLCALNMDPIEKKPLYHYLPQTEIVSVAMGGCNLRCPNCQNWEISQARPLDVQRHGYLPEALVKLAVDREVQSVAFTYTEPLVTFEYVRDSSALMRGKGIRNVLVTAGYINEAPLRELCRTIDAVTLDVKSFDEEFYRKVSGGKLHPVLRTLTTLKEEGVWLEVSFLMVTEISDEPSGVGRFAKWMRKELGEDTPLHLLRFHPQHKLRNLAPTPVGLMREARNLAKDAGLNHVYLGNVPGGDGGTTVCPQDGTVLIRRVGFQVVSNNLVGGACPSCGKKLAGVFG